MSWPIQDHADAVLALLTADAQLTVYDGAVPRPPATVAKRYALLYLHLERPDGTAEPGLTKLPMDATAIRVRAYVHCVGETASAARGISGRVAQQLLNVRPTVTGRVCFPIRWLEGQPPQRNEETLALSMDQVDVYGWTSVPG